MSSSLPLVCTGVVEKMGERFGEFGLHFRHRDDEHMAIDDSDLENIPYWHLYVYLEPSAGDHRLCADEVLYPPKEAGVPQSYVAFDDHVPFPKMNRVVKLEPGRRYAFAVRYYSNAAGAWSEWSPLLRTATFYPVVAHITGVGENYASFQWARATSRDTEGISPEADQTATQEVGNIRNMTLRVTVEATGDEVLHQCFSAGINTFTKTDLMPGTAYVVSMQYETLIGTMLNWAEVGRFFTEEPLVARLTSRGEDVFGFEWSRAPPPSGLAGYVVSSTLVHKYEIGITCEGMSYSPVQLPATQTSYRMTNLVPNTKFLVNVRSLSQEGRWGVKSNTLEVTTASRPSLSVVAVSETFASFTWAREGKNESENETELQYVVRLLGSDTAKMERTIEISNEPGSPLSNPSSASSRGMRRANHDSGVVASGQPFHVEGLRGSTEYTIAVRVLLSGEWGCWTEPLLFATSPRPSITVLERGEDFFTLCWPQVEDDRGGEKGKRHAHGRTESSVGFGSIVDDASSVGFDFASSSGSISGNASNTVFVPMLFQVVVTNVTAQRRGPSGAAPVVVLDEEIRPDFSEPGFRVSHLDANNTYEVKTRAWQFNRATGYTGWGEFSAPVRVGTLQPVALQVVDLGEDFALVSWWRGLAPHDASKVDGNNNNSTNSHNISNANNTNTSNVSGAGNANASSTGGGGAGAASGAAAGERAWDQLKYEVVVGCVDTEEDSILHIQVLESSYIINGLRPSTTYVISVRACDERNQWGLWSKLKLRTLASVVTSVHEIGEDFLRLMWQRRATGQGSRRVDVEGAEHFVSRYAILVYSEDPQSRRRHRAGVPPVPHAESGYPDGGQAEVAQYKTLGSEHTSARVSGLLPDRQYVAVVRAATATGKWGLWSAPIRFRTNRQFVIPVNNLSIGENYVNLVWGREGGEGGGEAGDSSGGPAHGSGSLDDADDDTGVVLIGDTTIISQQLRIHGVTTSYSKEYTLSPDARELKLYGLAPASAYSIQLRGCGKSGCWGLWSPPVHILTRATILTKTVEVAEDYAVISWERRKVDNPNNYPTGRGIVSAYHMRVYNRDGIHLETFLGDGDCPFRIPNLTPNTFYCVELKANYNDEEWGLWSVPLWCLTMQSLHIQTKLISEEFCQLVISRPPQQNRLPEDDGNPSTSSEKMIAFGQRRPHLLLCVTSPVLTKNPHSTSGFNKPKYHSSSLPPDAAGHRLVYQTDIVSSTDTTKHTVPNLKSNTVYSVSVRSRLPDGEWGMWAQSTLFATVPTTCVAFRDIGESFVRVEWKRHAQNIPPQFSESVIVGLGDFSASRVRIREVSGAYQRLYSVDNSANAIRLNDLAPATTYTVAVQTYNDNYDWGVWSEESKVRTVPGMNIHISHVSEDALWVSWTRLTDLALTDADVAMNVSIVAKSYEVCITGAGGFRYSKEMDSNALFFRGLQADNIYAVHVRVLFAETEEWGLWSTQTFRTKPLLRVTFGSIGESFAVVEWRRHLPTRTTDTDPNVEIVETDEVVLQYRFKVQRVGDSVPTVYDLSPYVGSFRMANLEPCSEYRIWMCAKGYEGVWGGWNEEARVRTLPKLQIQILDIGEDYVRVKWMRGDWDGEHMEDDGVDVRQVDGAVSGYQVHALNEMGDVVATQTTTFRETTCVLSGLSIAAIYSVEVCAKDTYGEWGLWSDAIRFATLHSVKVDLVQIGETFIDVEWARMKPSEETERKLAGAILSPVSSPRRRAEAGSGEGDQREDSEPRLSLPFQETMPVLRDDESVLQWHVRLQCRYSPDGDNNFTEESEMTEFYAEPAEERRRITDLIPGAEYTVTVRAQNKAKEWGHWGTAVVTHTYPLLDAKVEFVGETFINMVWERPPIVSNDLVCFPPINDIHNYQVIICPHETEAPFEEEDEPLVDGCRVYETTQPSLRLSNLVPGTYYSVRIREQQVDATRRPVEGSWGTATTIESIRTVSPLRVIPTEIGEDYCLVQWERASSSRDRSDEAPVVLEYEIHATRLRNDATTVYSGPLALDSVVSVQPTTAQYAVENLQQNTIYQITVRAKGATGVWGLWSVPTKIVSQGRLRVRVDAVYEKSFIISWSRPIPSWASTEQQQQQRQSRSGLEVLPDDAGNTNTSNKKVKKMSKEKKRKSETSDDNDRQSPKAKADDDDDDDDDDKESSTSRTAATTVAGDDDNEELDLAKHASALAEVVLGDYTIEKYEVSVQGLSNEYLSTFDVPKERLHVSVKDLEQSQLYCVYVRSLSEGQHWSRMSNKESVFTMAPVKGFVAHLTESAVVLRWGRSITDLSAFTQLLERRRIEADRKCDEKERQELFELKKRLQELDDPEEKASEWLEQEARMERNAQAREEATHHFVLENVVTGSDDDSTGFHLRLFGETHCFPTIFKRGVLELLGVENDARGNDSVHLRTGAVNSNSTPIPATSTTTTTTATTKKKVFVDEVEKRRSKKRPQHEEEEKEEGDADKDVVVEEHMATTVSKSRSRSRSSSQVSNAVVLVDVLLRPKVRELTIRGLLPDSAYSFIISARNDRGEWQPWGTDVGFNTLPMVCFRNGRFGEEHIQLHWYRYPHEQGIEAKQQRLACLESKYQDTTAEDLARKRSELSPDEYNGIIEELKELKDLRTAMTQVTKQLVEGKGPMVAHDDTPIKGYQLRVVKENGTFVDTYIPVKSVTNPHQYTVVGLKPNRMHVCLLCVEYSVPGLWGSWTRPIKFMTQNHIQLQVTYMGETFVDIEWQRMENKRPAVVDRDDTLVSSPVPSEMLHYQVHVTHEDPITGKLIEELREIDAARSFRLENLIPDTKYGLAVREKDSKGNWSQWCSERTCVTLPNMYTEATDIGESWALVSWGRQKKRRDYDRDMDVLQYGEEALCYYLRVEEVVPMGSVPGSPRRESIRSETAAHADGTLKATETMSPWGTELEDLLTAAHAQGETGSLEGSVSENHKTVVTEFEGVSERGGHLVVRRCSASSFSERIDGLDPGRCYSIQVIAEMDGELFGSWSTPRFIVTLSKLCLTTSVIGEESAEVRWSRPKPVVPGNVVVPLKDTTLATLPNESYVLDIKGVRNSYAQTIKINRGVAVHKFTKLGRNSVYSLRIRGVSPADGEESMWSDPLTFVTLNAIFLMPLSITENSIHVGWDRPRQTLSDYDIDSPFFGSLHTGQPDFAKFRLSVRQLQSGGGAIDENSTWTPFLDKTFTPVKGQVSYPLENLPADTAFAMAMQAQHPNGDWSDWSVERVICTLPALAVCTETAGEDYLRVSWGRRGATALGEGAGGGSAATSWSAQEPPSAQQTQRQRRDSRRDEIDDLLVEAAGSASQKAPQQQQQRLQGTDGTPPSGMVQFVDTTTTAKVTDVAMYGVCVRRAGETTEGRTVEVAPAEVHATVGGLRLDTAYEVTVRAKYRFGSEEWWGSWSEPAQASTCGAMAVAIEDAGESFVVASWERLASASDAGAAGLERTVYYEVCVEKVVAAAAVHSRASVASAAAERIHFFVPGTQRRAVFGGLEGNTRYRVEMRRWYEPLEGFQQSATRGEPVTDSSEVRQAIEKASAAAGPFGAPAYATTLPGLKAIIDKVGEDFFSVRWTREAPAVASGSQKDAAVVPSLAAIASSAAAESERRERFIIRVDEMLADGTALSTGGGSYHTQETVEGAAMNMYFAENLAPNTTYRAQVCDGGYTGNASAVVMGKSELVATAAAATLPGVPPPAATAERWAPPVYAVTLPRFRVTVEDIQEDSVLIQWERHARALVLPDGSEAVLGQQDANDIYQVTVIGKSTEFSFSKRLKGTRTSYAVRDLKPGGLYAVQVRSSDNIRDTWGVWSEPLLFATQKPVLIKVGPPAEQFAHIWWKKDKQEVQEYDALLPDGDDVVLADAAVLGFQVVVFKSTESPSRPAATKNFPNNAQHFLANNLQPGTDYSVIVRVSSRQGEWTASSAARSFRTLMPLQLEVPSSGETFAEVQWRRELAMPPGRGSVLAGAGEDPSPATTGRTGPPPEQAPTRYRLVVKSGDTVLEKTIPGAGSGAEGKGAAAAAVSSFRVTDLAPGKLYTAVLQPCYGEGEWGLASREVTFLTVALQPMTVSAARDRIELVWNKSATSILAGAAFDSDDTVGSHARTNSSVKRYQVVACRAVDAHGVLSPLPGEGEEGGQRRRRYTALPDRDPASVPAGEALKMEKTATAKSKGAPLSCTLEHTDADTTYVVRTRAQYLSGEWGEWVESVVHTPPAPPTGLVLREAGTRSCALQWVAPEPLPGREHHQYRYIVEMMLESESAAVGGRRASVNMALPPNTWRVVDCVEQCVCALRYSGIASQVRCRVRCARRGAAEGHFFPAGEYSEVVAVSAGAAPPPEPVARLTVASLARDAARLEWRTHDKDKSSSGAAVYRVLLREEDGPLLEAATTSEAFCELEDLHALTVYTACVIAESPSDGALSCHNPCVRFTTRSERDRSVQRASRAEPLGESVDPSEAVREEARMNEPDMMLPTYSATLPKRASSTAAHRNSGSDEGALPRIPSVSATARRRSSTSKQGSGARPSGTADANRKSAVVPSAYGSRGSAVGKRPSKSTRRTKNSTSNLPSVTRTY